MEQSREKKLHPPVHLGVVAIEKGASGHPRQWSPTLLTRNYLFSTKWMIQRVLKIFCWSKMRTITVKKKKKKDNKQTNKQKEIVIDKYLKVRSIKFSLIWISMFTEFFLPKELSKVVGNSFCANGFGRGGNLFVLSTQLWANRRTVRVLCLAICLAEGGLFVG